MAIEFLTISFRPEDQIFFQKDNKIDCLTTSLGLPKEVYEGRGEGTSTYTSSFVHTPLFGNINRQHHVISWEDWENFHAHGVFHIPYVKHTIHLTTLPKLKSKRQGDGHKYFLDTNIEAVKKVHVYYLDKEGISFEKITLDLIKICWSQYKWIYKTLGVEEE